MISSKDNNEEQVMHSKSDNIEVKSRSQIGLETSIRRSDSIFDSAHLLYCKCHKTKFKQGGSYFDSPEWIEKKQTTITLKNKDDRCFQ